MKINDWRQDYNQIRPHGAHRQSGADGSPETNPSAHGGSVQTTGSLTSQVVQV